MNIPTGALEGIKMLRPSLICLANNHIFDQGEEGLYITINLLKNANIPFIGAGDNIETAYNSFQIDKVGKKVGIYACLEHKFGIADYNKLGVNPFDPLISFDHVNKLKSDYNCDYVIVIYHCDYEDYRYPSLYLRKVYRKFVEKGVDLVVTQHSHCIGTYEEFQNSTIVYDQGIFIFDYSNNELWDSSSMLKVTIDDEMKVEFIPFVRDNNTIRIANNIENKGMQDSFFDRSEKSLFNAYLEQKYLELSDKTKNHYLYSLSSHSIKFIV